MHALDLIKSWPSLQTMKPDDVLASPAWRYAFSFEDRPSSLTRTNSLADELFLSLSFDGEARVLGLADTPWAPDLHRLWAKRGDLPENLLLALVEKECGGLLQALENLSRAEVQLLGLADRATSAERMAFQLAQGEQTLLTFSLNLPQSLYEEFGRLENLNPADPSICTLTRSIRAHYATLALSNDEADRVQADDFLMLDETSPNWITDDPQDDAFHLVSAAVEPAAFSQFAEDKLPEIPAIESADLVLMRRKQILFKASLAKVGSALAVKLSANP